MRKIAVSRKKDDFSLLFRPDLVNPVRHYGQKRCSILIQTEILPLFQSEETQRFRRVDEVEPDQPLFAGHVHHGIDSDPQRLSQRFRLPAVIPSRGSVTPASSGKGGASRSMASGCPLPGSNSIPIPERKLQLFSWSCKW